MAQKSAVARGFPDDMGTYSMVSSIWTSAFALGSFVGPTASGALYEVVGFEWAMAFTAGWNTAVFILLLVSIMAERFSRDKEGERKGLFQKVEKGSYGSVQREEEKEVFTSQAEALLHSQDGCQTLRARNMSKE